jgi:hypothetical protein
MKILKLAWDPEFNEKQFKLGIKQVCSKFPLNFTRADFQGLYTGFACVAAIKQTRNCDTILCKFIIPCSI